MQPSAPPLASQASFLSLPAETMLKATAPLTATVFERDVVSAGSGSIARGGGIDVVKLVALVPELE